MNIPKECLSCRTQIIRMELFEMNCDHIKKKSCPCRLCLVKTMCKESCDSFMNFMKDHEIIKNNKSYIYYTDYTYYII